MNHGRALLGIVGWPNRASRFRAIAGGLIALFAVGSASAQCTVTVQGTPVAGAAYYELFSATVRLCYQGGGNPYPVPFEVPGTAMLVASATTPDWVVLSSPAFDGAWKVVAHSADGATVGSALIGAVGLHPAVGAPFLGTGATLVEACAGETAVLRPRVRPIDAQYQWDRDGVAIAGATASELSIDVEQSHAGALYSCTASNACGSTVAGPFLMEVSAGVADGLVDWRRCGESHNLGGQGSCVSCQQNSTTTIREGSCNALWTMLTLDNLSLVLSDGQSSSVVFELAAPARLQFTSVGVPNTSTYCSPYNGSSATLAGPVGANLRPTLEGGSGTIDLPAGQYLIAADTSHFNNFCFCGCATSTCTMVCNSCARGGNISLTVSFTPLPFDVPDVYPTIQAAIDAAPVGQHETVTVAPSVRNESFSLNGKDVLILGAPNNATILDGTGLTTSIATFTGDEPATAGLENLLFRNGTEGTLLHPKTPFTVGGALYGNLSSAFVKNCRFESCSADFGGAVYLYESTTSIEGCEFAENTAIQEGGGILAFRTTAVLRNCDFMQNVSGVFGPGSGSGFKSVGARVAGDTVLLEACTFTDGVTPGDGAAVEHFEDSMGVPGVLRLVDTLVSGNGSSLGAGGLRVLGTMQSCVLAGTTEICANTQRNVDGPFFLEGAAEVCDCLADVTHDGQINGADIGVVLNAWGLTLPTGNGDINHDGLVNGFDLGILLNSWGICPR